MFAKGNSVFLRLGEDKNTSHIKNQIRAAQDTLNKMNIVSSVKSNDVIELSKPELRKIGEIIFNNIIYNKEIGEIHCKSKIINGALNYVNTKAEKAALVTVPDVLRKGVAIHIQENHKNRNSFFQF